MKEKKRKLKPIFTAGIVGIIVLAAGFLYFLHASDDTNRLAVLSGYFSAVVGTVVTYAAFAFTYLANERNLAGHKDELNQLRILNNKPVIAIYPTDITTSVTGANVYISEQGASSTKQTQNYHKVFEIVNAGNNSAISIKLGECMFGVVHSKSSIYINIHLPMEGLKGITELSLPIDFCDLDGRHYRQYFKVNCDDEKFDEERYSFSSTSTPEFIP